MSPGESATLLYVVKQVELAISSAMEDAVAAAGLTSTQYTALTVLDRHPGMTAAALARNSFVRAQTAASLVGALERRGLIERRPDPASRRQHPIVLTATGRQVLSELEEPVRAIEDRMTASMGAGEREDLYVLLQKCRTALAADPSAK